MAFMISRETENVQSSSEVEQAFRALTSGDKLYITSQELYANLTREQADYCIQRMKPFIDRTGRTIPDAYDYADFTANIVMEWLDVSFETEVVTTAQHDPKRTVDMAQSQYDAGGTPVRDQAFTGMNRDPTGINRAPPG
ncbi:hypothetical protein DPMN_155734 [Dreissena polymorpha]|uniref:EF-hand Ca insensitive domain-containing protein n=1 Tax=Dreissena polymorpha TaxID=45954 RepID=A0A9D4FPY3_DREPO|nr:hypothetical protein DPMN_155734 [Dreissena polymorpha]